ncbi:MAG: hypothetical protein HFJ94_00495 [Muribaculaceae bacterium]|nr:hypothetical protein [Muribaculaceae bacterium]
MKKSHLIIYSVCALLSAPAASGAVAPASAAAKVIERTENTVYVNTDIDISSLKRGSNRETWIVPMIVNGADTLRLHGIMVAGRNRYYQAERHNTATKNNLTLYRASDDLKSVPYTAAVPYQKWMNGAQLVVSMEYRGCCEDELEPTTVTPLANIDFEPKRFQATYNWIAPQAEAVKHRELRGQAFIDFPVNKTVIYPEYRRNTVELAKIQATIDSVHNDKDITINALSIKGFASPEGPWDNNVRLAKGRTAALKTYVEQLYNFAPDFIQTSYDPEDWGGLKAYVEKSNIPNREGILEIIDSNLKPDPKNSKIQSTYPEQYKFLLANVYPALRHSDYKIEYTIRSYSDVNEIRELVRTRPQNLSLQEFFLAAKSVEQGSQEFNDIYLTAVRMYPQDEVANLNAANVAMSMGDFTSAARYLDKAGDGPEAIYARGILEALSGNYEAARENLGQAARLKVADAPAALEQLNEIQK